MSIRFDSEARIFVLETAHTSYHMKVDALGHLLHLYYGKTIGTGDLMQLYPRTDRGRPVPSASRSSGLPTVSS